MAQKKNKAVLRLSAAAMAASLSCLGMWQSVEAQTAGQADVSGQAAGQAGVSGQAAGQAGVSGQADAPGQAEAAQAPAVLEGQPGMVFGAGSLGSPLQAEEEEAWKGDRVWLGGSQWRVLETGERLLLLSEEILETGVAFHEDGKEAGWEESSLRRRLNSTEEEGFLGEWFTPEEQAAILHTEIQTGEETTLDRVFVLSAEDMEKTEYGFCGDQSRAARDGSLTGDWWWLRTPGYDGNDAANVYYDGGVDHDGYMVSYGEGGLRPALFLDAGAILLMARDEGGAVEEGNDGSGAWRLFLKGGDTGFCAETEEAREEPVPGESLEISFGGAPAEYDQAYGMIYTREEGILYFGKIADSGRGTVQVQIPEELEAGKEYRLGVFAGHMEEERGSGFASNVAEIPLVPAEAGVLEELQVELEPREDGVYLKAMEEEEGVQYFYRVAAESQPGSRPAYGDSLEGLPAGTVSGNMPGPSQMGATVSGNLPAGPAYGIWKEFSEDTKIEEAAGRAVYVQVARVEEGKITGWGEALAPAVEVSGKQTVE